jgi:hypothetical protein
MYRFVLKKSNNFVETVALTTGLSGLQRSSESCLCAQHEGVGAVRVSLLAFLTSTLDGSESSKSGRFILGGE